MRNESTQTEYIFPLRTDVPSGTARFDLIGWAGFYQLLTPGTCGAVRRVVLDGDTVLQPDVVLHVLEAHGGRCTITEGYYDLEGAPELIGDVVGTDSDADFIVKRNLYRRFGVREYIVWRVADRALDWFVLRNGYYWTLDPGADGIIRSEVFPGLWLDPAALLRGDAARLLAVAQLGHGSPEHTAFAAGLRRRAGHPT